MFSASFLRKFKEDSLSVSSLYLMINAAGTSALGFVFWMLAARLYSPNEIGVGASIINAMTILSFLSIFGIQIGLLRFLPVKNEQETRSLLNSAFTLTIISSAVLGLAFTLTAAFWSLTFGDVLGSFGKKMFFTLFVMAWGLHLLLNAVLIAKKRSDLVLLKDTGFFSVAKILLLFPLIGLGAYGIFSSWGFGIVFGIIIIWLLFFGRSIGGYHFRPSGIKKELLEIVNYSLTNYVGEIFRILPTLLLPIIAVHLISQQDGGYFYISWMVANVIFIMIYMFTLPIVVEGAEDITQLKHKMAVSNKLAVAVFTPGIIILLVFPSIILNIIGGAEGYEEGSMLLRLLAISAIPFLVNNILVAKSRIYQNNDVLWIYGLSTIITISLSILWFQSMGIVGGGWAWLLGQVIVAAIFGPKELLMEQKNR